MAEKTRVKGEIDKKFSIEFDESKGDQFFILFKEKRFPKNRAKKGLPPSTVDFVQSSSITNREQALMFFSLYKGGDAGTKNILGQFISMVVDDCLRTTAVKQHEHEKQAYIDSHNGNINKKKNNLSSNEE